MKDTRSCPLEETFSEKLPSMTVMVPLLMSTSVIFAPITASPKVSFTIPLTVLLCAIAYIGIKLSRSNSIDNLKYDFNNIDQFMITQPRSTNKTRQEIF